MTRRLLIAIVILIGLTAATPARQILLTTPTLDSIIGSTNPTLWLDPDHKLTLDGSSLVSSWCSRTGSVCFTQSNSTYRPAITVANGKRVLSLDGSNHWLSSTSQLGAVFSSNAKTFILVGQAAMSDNDDILAVGADIVQLQFSASGFNFRNYATSGVNNTVAFTANTPYLVFGTHDGVNTGVIVNGGNLSSIGSGATSALTNTMYLGQFGTGANYYNGKIYYILAWNKVLSLSTIKAIGIRLASKYAITTYVK